MTREEALEVIKSHPFLFASFPDDVLEALDVLIKQEPTTKNDLTIDLLDRAELLKAMDTWDKFGNDPNEGLISLSTPALQDRYVLYVKYDDMVNCVKGMPSVTSQPRKGHWIVSKDYEGCPVWQCSLCGSKFDDSTKFCPNCGADMRKEKK